MFAIKTKTKELPSFYPLTVAFSNSMPPTGSHVHDCVEIAIVIRGSAVHVCGGERKKMVAGDVIVVPTGASHCYEETENCDIMNVLFHPKDLNIPQHDLVKFPEFREIFMPENEDGQKPVVFFHMDKSEMSHVRKILSLMRAEQKKIGCCGFRSAMLGLFMNLLCHLLRSFSSGEQAVSNNYEQNIDIAIKHLKTHYLEPFDLEFLLKISAMSRSNFMKLFRDVTGVAPKQFVLCRRIAYAARRIAKSDVPFSEIAIECGFHDSSHFCKAFKHIAKETPRAYRERVKKHSDKEFSYVGMVEHPFLTEPDIFHDGSK
jgi:AraC-like DNA-binding protein